MNEANVQVCAACMHGLSNVAPSSSEHVWLCPRATPSSSLAQLSGAFVRLHARWCAWFLPQACGLNLLHLLQAHAAVYDAIKATQRGSQVQVCDTT